MIKRYLARGTKQASNGDRAQCSYLWLSLLGCLAAADLELADSWERIRMSMSWFDETCEIELLLFDNSISDACFKSATSMLRDWLLAWPFPVALLLLMFLAIRLLMFFLPPTSVEVVLGPFAVPVEWSR